MSSTRKIQFVMKPDFISVVLGGRPFNVLPDQPVFQDLKAALEKKNWEEIPNLVSLGRKLASQNDNITIHQGNVYYKGRFVDSSLTRRIVQMLNEGEKIGHMLLFMDNVYQNPSQFAIDELFDWMQGSKLPITDDGRILAYKAVRHNYRDVYTGEYDNSPGSKPEMRRKDVDPDRRNECSRGFHFCSLDYLKSFGGDRIMIIAVNPSDVVSIPKDYNYTKGRCWTYEVLKEYGDKGEKQETEYSTRAIEPIAMERQEMLNAILAHPVMKRKIKKGKIQESTLRKQTYARLKAYFEKLPQLVFGKNLGNPLKAEREKLGYTLEQLANEIGVSRSAIWSAEKSVNPKAETINNIRLALHEMVEKEVEPRLKAKAVTS